MPATPANVAPLWSKAGAQQWATLTTANTATDGTGTVGTVFTADADNGGLIESVVLMPLGGNVASVARVFINNGGANSSAANNTLIGEVSLPVTTLTQTAAQTPMILPLNLMLPPGYKVLVTLGTTVAAGWQATGIGGKY